MLEISTEGDSWILRPKGVWTLSAFEELRHCCGRLSGQFKSYRSNLVLIDGGALSQLDTAGADTLVKFITIKSEVELQQISLQNFHPEHQKIFELVWERLARFRAEPVHPRSNQGSFLYRLGKLSFDCVEYLRQIFNFLGLVAEGFLQIILNPKLLRLKELVTQIEEACVKAIPVVALVTFLIGIVVAYLMAMQVQKFGGEILVVNGVALTMCRELSPILVAIIMAGRSGSAFTAQLGAMRLNEEVDALTALGLSPMHVLIIPRILALVICIPLLVFVGDLVGIGGGMLIANNYLDITYAAFIERLHVALPVKHFVVGMVKAPVFAAVIAMIGCRRGLSTEMSARAVGLSTTATVVESIVLVILLNAAFSVTFAELGI